MRLLSGFYTPCQVFRGNTHRRATFGVLHTGDGLSGFYTPFSGIYPPSFGVLHTGPQKSPFLFNRLQTFSTGVTLYLTLVFNTLRARAREKVDNRPAPHPHIDTIPTYRNLKILLRKRKRRCGRCADQASSSTDPVLRLGTALPWLFHSVTFSRMFIISAL